MTIGVPKDIIWVASSRDDLQRFPDPVKKLMGFALFQAQCGGKHLQAKPLKGFKGGRRLRATCVPEEVQERDPDPEAGDGHGAIPTSDRTGVVPG